MDDNGGVSLASGDSLSSLIARREEQLIDLRRDLHRHPELAFGEHRTAERVADRLHRAGLEVTTGVAGTGVVAVLRGDHPGRTIAWRADMDALPLVEAVDVPFASATAGVMHACGHDGHTAIAVEVAEILAARRASLPGTAVFLFQPAEEIFGGARRMIEAGVLEREPVDEIYGLHIFSRLPLGLVELVPGVSMASADFIDIEIRGRGGHGATPHLAVDPIAVAAHILVGLQDMVRATVPAQQAAVLTIGQVAAGSAPNIIPETALLRGSLRALRERDRREVLERLADYCAAVATGFRASAELRQVGDPCPVLVSADAQTARATRSLEAELGAERVVRGAPVMASDDMSLFLERVPGCFFRVGACPPGRADPPGHHSPDFEIDEACLAIGVRAGASLLLHCLAP
jgi:amidohydrolase